MCRLLAPALVVLLVPCARAADPVDFAHDILPLLKARCVECHTGGKYKGGVSMDTREALVRSKAVVPGKGGQSPLIQRVTEKDPEQRMPPKGKPLTEKEVALLRAWIDQGAAWQPGFSFTQAAYVAPLKPRRVDLPPGTDSQGNPLDRILDAYYKKHKVTPPAPADDATFLRRASLDLVGLLPAPERLGAFLADAAPEKRAKLIGQLLDDRHAYAEHWLTFWNDLLRNDYVGTGYIDGGRKQITGWLYKALLDNKPYDQFVRELVSPSPDSEGFIKGIKWRGVVNASQVQEVQFAQNIGQVFLGINLKCASCHDSFIDSWKLEDAYSLAAVVADAPPEIHRCDKPTGVKARARFLFPELGELDPSRPKEERLRRLAELLTHSDNGRFARTIVNRLWQRLFGRGLVHPVDVMGNEPWNADLLDYLAVYLVEQGYDIKKILQLIVSSKAYQAQCVHLAAELPATDYVFQGPVAKRLTAEQFFDAVWRVTGTAPAKPAFAAGDRGKDPVRASLVASDPLMRSLGRPNREQVVTTRPEELSTLQALDLTNGQILTDLLDRGAKNLLKRHGGNAEALTEGVYRAALGRRPSGEEAETGRRLLGTPVTPEGLSDLLWAVFMLPEFQMVR